MNPRPLANARDSGDARPILIIDDDPGTSETLSLALAAHGYRTLSAASAEAGMALARVTTVSLIVIDLRLGDALGTEVIRACRNDGCDLPFVLISGFLTIPTAVAAAQLGSVDVLEKPFDVDEFIVRVAAMLKTAAARTQEHSATPTPPRRRSCSIAERWAEHVLRGVECDVDPKTLATWARHVAVSYATLCETCRLAGAQPHDARDFCRVLRALVQARATGCPADMLLDVSDRRTLKTLMARAGVDWSGGVEDFLQRQRFIDRGSGGFLAVLALLRRRGVLSC